MTAWVLLGALYALQAVMVWAVGRWAVRPRGVAQHAGLIVGAALWALVAVLMLPAVVLPRSRRLDGGLQ